LLVDELPQALGDLLEAELDERRRHGPERPTPYPRSRPDEE
jgi:hypothetical protein